MSEHSQALLGVSCTVSILFMSLGSVSRVLCLLVLIKLNQWLHLDHLAVVLPGACFLGLWCGFRWAENWGVAPLFHVVICLELSS